MLGRNLVHDILKRPYCHPERSSKKQERLLKLKSVVNFKPYTKNVVSNKCDRTNTNFNYDTNYGGSSLGLWVERVEKSEGIEVKLVKGNKELVHYARPDYYKAMWWKYVHHVRSNQLCKNNLLFHKSSVRVINTLNKYN